MKYDDASWHAEGEFPSELSATAANTHIAFFLIWAWKSGLGGDSFDEFREEFTEAVSARETSPGAIFSMLCDGKLTDEDLSEEGNAFALSYYEDTADGYLPDYEKTIASDLPTIYHVADTWGNFDIISCMIEKRYAEWKKSHPED